MTIKILAETVSFTDDGYSSLLGFADSQSAPVRYVMLNMTNEPDEQDLGLGLDGIHIDAGALKVEGYDLVQDIRETDTGVVVCLTEGAVLNAGIGQNIEIELSGKMLQGITLGEVIQRFQRRLLSKK